jgi:alpha-L-fucosidase
MAALCREAGAKYVVLTAKSHDGFALWPTDVKNSHLSPDRQKAARDIAGELAKSVRTRGLRMGLYYSGGLDWSFSTQPIERREQVATSVLHSTEYARYADAQWRELINRYEPDILWNDVAYPVQGELESILAGYYNHLPEGVINNRWGTRLAGGERRPADFSTPEYEAPQQTSDRKWELLRGLGYSLGYNRQETSVHMLGAEQLIHLLVDVVSKNGNLLLSIGPEADGTVSRLQSERLRALGQWLAVNGEAVYGTRPWTRAEGTATGGVPVRFTQRSGALYVILLGKPAGPDVTIESLAIPENASVALLGREDLLPHRIHNGGLSVTLPALSHQAAHVLKIAPMPRERLP